MRSPVTALVALLCLALPACGGTASEATTTIQPSSTTPPLATSTTITSSTTVGEDLPEDSAIVDAAIAALAEHLSVPTDAVEVVTARAVTWPDGALGCPEPGQMYTQALVDGYQILLRANERVYDYHAGADGEVFLCPSEEKDGGYDFLPPPGAGED